MKNIEKYGSNLKAAVSAYKDEMAKRTENGIDGCFFEDWVEEDETFTAQLIENKRKEEEAAEKALEEEKESIRKGIKELKAHYKANGFEEANTLSTEIYRVAPKYDLYINHNSACNCFHSGMWEVWCEDFEGVWDFYTYIKKEGGSLGGWKNPVEWFEQMKGLAGYIKPFVDEAKPLVEELKAKGGQAK